MKATQPNTQPKLKPLWRVRRPMLSVFVCLLVVAGAVTGGGLTVIANAPNPAGFGILKNSFGKEGIKPIGLFIGSLVPTFIAFVCLWLLPSFDL